MFKPLALFVGLRYIRTRKKNHLISFVSVVSMLGITLGVLALIAVLSVINGSTSTMRDETLKAVAHATVTGADPARWQELAAGIAEHPRVLSVTPFRQGEGWLRHQGSGDFVQIRAVDPRYEVDAPGVEDENLSALIAELDAVEKGIIVGYGMGTRMGLYPGQAVTITPLQSLTSRNLGDVATFNVIGMADFGFYANDSAVVVHLDDATELFARSDRAAAGSSPAAQAGLQVQVSDVFNAGPIVTEAVQALPVEIGEGLTVQSWSESQSSLFDALRLEKTLTGFMLLMIVVIGAVNIVSTLVMVVADKSADIAILRTMGASKGTIMSIFIAQGSFVGLLGTLLGAFLGVVLALNLSGFTAWFETLLNTTLGDVYVISHLRAELNWPDVIVVSLCALLISFLATLYPAWRASRIHPAEVLRYE